MSQHGHPILGLDTAETGKTRGKRVEAGERLPGSGGMVDDEPTGARTRILETYPAVPESVVVVRSVIGDFAARGGATAETIDAVRIAVSEAATNVIVHAYPDPAEGGVISLEATLASGRAARQRRRHRPRTAHRETSQGPGLGLAMINQLADHVELLQGDSGGLHVLMRFSLPASTGAWTP